MSTTPSTWGVIDAARDERLLPAIRALCPAARCLFDEPVDPGLADAAPWLLPLVRGERFLDWWRTEGLGQSWGIAFTSAAAPDALRRHLKKLLRAQLPAGEVVYFRFYDPRVLRTLLATADTKQLRQVFGPIDTLYVESEGGTPVLTYRRGADGGVATTAA